MLDAGTLPVEDLVMLAVREGRRPRPIYQAHRWFARRFGSAFRALLIAAAIAPDADFWASYHEGADWHGRTVLDPFVGGGTSVVEAHRLGADVIGVDVDGVACAITRFELHAATMPDLHSALDALKRDVGETLRRFYMTTDTTGAPRRVLHYFWVQVVRCRGCAQQVEAHPHYQLAHDAKGTQQWVCCPHCHSVAELTRDESDWRCRECGQNTEIARGTVCYGVLTCPTCHTQERLIDVAQRTGEPPSWRLFALETLPETGGARKIPLRERRFQRATATDQALYDEAATLLGATADSRGTLPWIPSRSIPVEGRSDDRLVRYGYKRYRDLFNARQLLHLSTLAAAISQRDGPTQEAFSLAFSDHLLTNCMLTHYAFGWRRLAPLFSVRAYRHIPRPVEINPWLEGTGRGTFPNAVRQVQRAIAAARAPSDALLEGGFTIARASPTPDDQHATVVHGTSERLSQIARTSVDLILSDPPYFDNIAYAELSDFFLPWLQLLGLVGTSDEYGWEDNLAGHDRDEVAATDFERRLGSCFAELARVLKPDGRIVFTYQHSHPRAWLALGRAIAPTGLHALQVFPLLGNTAAGLHVHDGTITWDAVFVLGLGPSDKRASELTLTDRAIQDAQSHCERWSERLSPLTDDAFHPADRQSFARACMVAAALGAFPSPPTAVSRSVQLETVLLVNTPDTNTPDTKE